MSITTNQGQATIHWMKKTLVYLWNFRHDKSCEHPDVLGDYSRILHAVQYETSLGKSTWRELFTKYKRRSILVMVVQTCVQLQGINVIPVQ